MYSLRPYQEEAVSGLFDFFETHSTGNPVVALPPGAGKSIIIAEFCRRALMWWPQTRLLNLVHVQELTDQAMRKLVAIWPTAPVGVYHAGLKRRNIGFPITFAGRDSIAKRVKDFGHQDLVLIDEADCVSHKEGTRYRKILDELAETNPAIRIIGLTGTPFRMGLGALTEGGVFTDTIIDYCHYEKFNSLVDAGWLCPLIPRRTDTELDVGGVHMQGGDFVLSELQDAVDKHSVTVAAIKETLALAHDRNHIMVFCTGVKHANHTRDILLEMGQSALCVHTEEAANREANISAFLNGSVRFLVGVGVFGVGFDAPTTDCIVLLRPTGSPRIHVQFCGRGLRPHPSKKNCLVLDYARNTVRCGPVNDPVLPRKPGQKKQGMVPFKLCPQCNCYAHTRAAICPDCGFEFPITFKGTQHASEAELIRRSTTPPPLPKPKKERPPPPLPELETYRVNRIEFAKHRPRDPLKAESLKVSYVCGVRIIPEYLCFGHPKGLPKHKANSAWREMAKTDPPATVDEALARSGELRAPTEIRVLSGKYDEVVGRDFN